MDPVPVPSIVTRRTFGLALMAGTTSTVLSPSDAAAQDKPKPIQEPASPPQPENAREIPEPIYLLGAVLRHYSDKRLDEAAIGGILRDITGDLSKCKVLSNFPLKNSDEPGYVFRAWRFD